MVLSKRVIWQGMVWHEIEHEDNENMREAGFVILKRPVSYATMKRQGGQMATAIDAKWTDLVAKYPRILKEFNFEV